MTKILHRNTSPQIFGKFLAVALFFSVVIGSLPGNSMEDGVILPSQTDLKITGPLKGTNPTPIFPDRDTYVDTGNPTSNFGGQDYLYIGDKFDDWCYTYIHFNFTEKPTTFEHAYLSLDPNTLSETMNLTIGLLATSETWDEYTLTYMNRPEETIDSIDARISREDQCWIEITSFFTGNSLSDLNLMINTSVLNEHYMVLYAKEMGSAAYFPPVQLTFVEAGDSIDMSFDEYEPTATEILPTKDTYIDSDYALANFGGLDTVYMGTGYGDNIYASIFHFENIPESTTVLNLAVDLYSVDETTKILVTIFPEGQGMQTWDELTLNYLNWPYPSVINYMDADNANFSVWAVSSDVLTIDIVPWAGNASLDIILTLPLLTEDYVIGYSKEGASWIGEPPLLNVNAPITTTTSSSSTLTSDSTSSTTSTSSTNTEETDTDGEATIAGEDTAIPGFPLIWLMGVSVFVLLILKRTLSSRLYQS